ncbi:MAG: hypothetical protein LUI07_02845 [Lachnospiraceae bacterium]|nr:hypothetical protein [Lachnospiraceae bacterium]
MSYLPTERKVYYYRMQGSHCLFADERIKKHLIDLISEIRERDGWLLFAFCIMDDDAYFIIEAGKIAAVVRSILISVRRLLCQTAASDRRRSAGAALKSRIELTGQTQKLDTLPEIVECCRSIHRIPLNRGYVCRLEDYWWSSYPSYTGLHVWESVDQRVVSLYFSTDPDVARKKLKKFHTAGAERLTG